MSAFQNEIKEAMNEALKPLVDKIAKLERRLSTDTPLIDVKTKAKLLGVTPETVRRRVRDGLLKCHSRNGNRMMFSD